MPKSLIEETQFNAVGRCMIYWIRKIIANGGKTIAIAGLLPLFSCRHSNLKVVSYPEQAAVQIYDVKSHSFAELGKTPMEIKSEQIDRFGPNLTIRVSKSGYVSEQVNLTSGSYTEIETLVRLDKFIDPNAHQSDDSHDSHDSNDSRNVMGAKSIKDETQIILQDFIADLQLVNAKMQLQMFDDAQKILDRLMQRYPKVAALWDMKGSVFLKKGDRKMAMDCYQQSLKIRPDNMVTRKKLVDLQGLSGKEP
jgi:tetratricopeptide (TPR) repeat protein